MGTKDHYRKALWAARVERETLFVKRQELDQQRAQIELEIVKMDEVIRGLTLVYDDDEKNILERYGKKAAIPGINKDLSLADACRAVLASADRYMSALRVREELKFANYPLDQANPLAGIHGVLKRFAESGEADTLEVEGRTGYRLASSPETTITEKGKKK